MTTFDYNKLSDPRFFAENRLPARADFDYYPGPDAAYAARVTGANPLRLSLNGLWKFHYARNLTQLIHGCEASDFDCRDWDEIRVPGHMQLQGYGIPQYANVNYPWDGHETLETGNEIPERFNPVGTYVRYFTLPDDWQGERVVIRFDGVENALILWLNGEYVGYSTDSFTPAEFDLTPYLQDGENKLTAQVFRFSASSWVEDQDFFRFSGIFRDVILLREPTTIVRDYTVRTDLADDLQEAAVTVVFDVEGDPVLDLVLVDPFGEVAAETRLDGRTDAAFELREPLLWSAEDPQLYQLQVTVLTGDDSVGYFEQSVGVRRFELKDGLMCLNGKRIVFNGANRHDFSADHGRAVTRQDIYQDLVTMKQYNINAVRTSHYPNRSCLYDLADELGLYVIAESNMESHGTWGPTQMGLAGIDAVVPGNREEWLEMMLDRIDSCYQRDKNHPSILIWSIGNESWYGSVTGAMSARFRELDDTRLVHYEGDYSDTYNTTEMWSQMYTTAERVEAYIKEHPQKPFILCEYTHAMGNSCGGMHKYTDLADREPLYQGGFIWDFIDQAIRTRDINGREYFAYGGDFGDRPHDNNFSGDGIVFGDHGVSPKMQEVKANYQPLMLEMDDKGFTLRNRSLFTNSSEWRCVVTLACEGAILKESDLETAVEPGSSAYFEWPWAKETVPGEYVLTVSFRLWEATSWAPADHEAAFGQAVYRVEAAAGETLPSAIALSPRMDSGLKPVGQNCRLVVSQGLLNVGVKGLDFEAIFSTKEQGLYSYNYGGVELLKEVVKPSFWRAPTDNDRGCGFPREAGAWKLASSYADMVDPDLKAGERNPKVANNDDGTVSVIYRYTLPTTPESFCELTYTVHEDGTITVRLFMDASAVKAPLPEFGLLLPMSAVYDQLTWYGLGPDETYWDRKRGGKLDVWSSTAADSLAPYLRPQESGAHQQVRWARVSDYSGRGLVFMADPEGQGYAPAQGREAAGEISGGMVFSALPFTPEEIENAKHAAELPPITRTIVRITQQQRGVGGDDSWGAPVLPEYHLDTSRPLDFTFSFRGVI